MIRKFLATTSDSAGQIITCKIKADDSYSYTWSMGKNPTFEAIKNETFTEHLKWMLSNGWKEVTSGIDPNDLQASCDHRKYDVSTDSCAICGKDWNQILWTPPNPAKPCCGGGLAGMPSTYGGGKWHDADCDSLKAPITAAVSPSIEFIDYRPKPSYRCQCGAQATSNPNCHSTWCPEHKK